MSGTVICPIMSSPYFRYDVRMGNAHTGLNEVECLRERCAAWGPVNRTLPGAAINGCRIVGGVVP